MKHDYDSRTMIVLGFTSLAVAALMTVSTLTALHVIPPSQSEDWRLVSRVTAILACAALAAFGVLASVSFGIKQFSLFSRLDRIFTHLPIGIIGLAMAAFASYTILTEVSHSISDVALLLVGSFLCFWVFLFYGRESSKSVGEP